MQKAKKMCLNFGKCRLPNFYVNPGFSGKLFTVEQRQKMLDLAAKNREMLMSFRTKSKDKGVTHESSETNRSVCTTHERNETEGNTKTSSQLLAMEQVLDNELKYRKQADERIHVLNTNSNSPSLVMKEQSQNDSKAGQDTVQKDDALNTNNDRQELEHNDLAADMMQTIINSQEQCSEGEIELGAHYSMSEEAMMNMQVLVNLATEGEVQWM